MPEQRARTLAAAADDPLALWLDATDRALLGRVAIVYSASMTPAADAGMMQTVAVTNGTAMTINAPTAPSDGLRILFDILNSSGGAMGVITWNAVFLLAGAFVNPANTKRRTISFYYNAVDAKWIEVGRAAADI